MNNDELVVCNIAKWLNIPIQDSLYLPKFNFFTITSKDKQSDDLIREIQDNILFSYREKQYLEHHLKSLSNEDIIKVVTTMIAENKDLGKQVRTGDFGEILVKLIILYFYKLQSYNKLKFKLNKDRSTFATDLVAFDDINNPKEIYYYEVKTRKSLSNNITVVAYQSLEKDTENTVQPILEFMAARFWDSNNYELSEKYFDLALNSRKVKQSYELYILTQDLKTEKIKKICTSLKNYKTELSPLTVTLLIVPDLYVIKDRVWDTISKRAIELYGKK